MLALIASVVGRCINRGTYAYGSPVQRVAAHCIADDLEEQELDFKQWDMQSRDKAVRTVVQMAVCMANGGGGTVVFGVSDRFLGQEQAVLGIPLEVDVNLLKKAVYDQTDPKIMPVFEEFTVPQGTGRVLDARSSAALLSLTIKRTVAPQRPSR